jgi:hypothetical protein
MVLAVFGGFPPKVNKLSLILVCQTGHFPVWPHVTPYPYIYYDLR